MAFDSIVFARGIAREATIWSPFQFNGPFGAVHAAERTILFGMYANAYLNGFGYLNEIDAIELARLVGNYEAAMAKLTGEQAQLASGDFGKVLPGKR